MFKSVMLRILALTCLCLGLAVPAFAVSAIDPLFTAFDISGLSTNITTLMIAGVGLMLLFAGYRYLKRTSRTV